METKPKPCKGVGKAISVKGCGTVTLWRRYGLCADCLADFLFGTDAGKLLMQKSIMPKAKTATNKVKKEERKKLKEKLKTLSQYKAEAKKSFQKFIRLRDSEQPCISCNTYSSDIWDGGHYKKAELYSGVVFDERNTSKQCRYCNRFLGGNESNYRAGLVKRFGEEYVLELESYANETKNKKYTKQELIDIKKLYDSKIKSLYLNL